MNGFFLKILYLLQIDKISDRWKSLIDEVKIMRIRAQTGQNLKYVKQGWQVPQVTCARGDGKFSIGKDSHLKSDSFIEYMGGVRIGNHFTTGKGLTIFTSNHDYNSEIKLPYGDDDILREVVIGDWVWCGANVTIVPGVHVGDGAVIGSGAVLTKDVPECAVVGGNPAKIIKYRDKETFLRLKREMDEKS